MALNLRALWGSHTEVNLGLYFSSDFSNPRESPGGEGLLGLSSDMP